MNATRKNVLVVVLGLAATGSVNAAPPMNGGGKQGMPNGARMGNPLGNKMGNPLGNKMGMGNHLGHKHPGNHPVHTPKVPVVNPNHGVKPNHALHGGKPNLHATPLHHGKNPNLYVGNKFGNYHLKHGIKFQHGFYYTGLHHKHWSKCSWFGALGCWGCYCPSSSCWYYWCAPDNCYYPFSYCPYGFYGF